MNWKNQTANLALWFNVKIRDVLNFHRVFRHQEYHFE